VFGGIQKVARRVAPGLFGYDAVETTTRRKPPVGRRRSEDRELLPQQRIVLSNATRDLQRNFAIAAWAIRKHLDYVSSFMFQSDTGDDAFDSDLEDLMHWYELPQNFDAAQRMSRARFIRMAEARRVLDGDVFLNFLIDGHLQGIEGDRVVDPMDPTAAAMGFPGDPTKPRWMHGVLVNSYGRAQQYAVHRRTFGGEGLEFDRLLSPAFCYHHGYFDRFDQVRGISPLSPACNPLRDVYENFDYALAKAKVSQLFALAVTRKAAEDFGVVEEVTAATADGTDAADAAAVAGDQEKPRYEISFGKGPIFMDLDEGDDAKILESQTPSDQFQSFTNSMIGVSLKALDIPFSFYDEGHTNYSGQRQAWIQYDESAEVKREDNRALLNWITARRISLFVRDGDLKLPPGMGLGDVLRKCSWINRGIPWIDPLKDITADVAAIKAGQLGPETACRQRGVNVYKMIDERARVEKYAREHPLGPVVLEYDVASLAAAQAASAAADQANSNDNKVAPAQKSGRAAK
jgi:capsid protein